MNGHGTAVATEWELAATRRRLVAYPQALNAVVHTYLAAYRHMADSRADAKLSTWLTRIVINQTLMRRHLVELGDGALGSHRKAPPIH